MASISAANTVLVLTVPGLLAPTQIQGFAPDSVITVESLDNAETQMGVDGFYVAGFVYVPVRTTLTLSAAAAANTFFETLYSSEQQIADKWAISGIFTFSALKRSYIGATGYMKGYHPFADAGRVMQPRSYMIEWQSLLGSAF